jgi:hypothetical protein
MIWVGHVLHTGKRNMLTQFWFESLKERDLSENLSLDGRIILKKCILMETERKWMSWIYVAKDRDRLWALVNTVIN